ncbi:signal peptidase I [Clostridia bacterium]|nr:signal peptidase I [Clostridia bacterium]
MQPDYLENTYIKRREELFSLIQIALVIAIAVIFASLFQSDISSPRGISGASMQPTFNNYADYTNWGEVRDGAYITRLSPIRRGDIVVLKVAGKNESYIKRVIGLGGDEIMFVETVVEGRTYARVAVNGELLQEDYLGQAYREHDYGFDINKTPSTGEPIAVPPQCYYVLGDNRDNSSDSRILGAISASDVEGKVYMKVTPEQSFWDGLRRLVFEHNNGM